MTSRRNCGPERTHCRQFSPAAGTATDSAGCRIATTSDRRRCASWASLKSSTPTERGKRSAPMKPGKQRRRPSSSRIFITARPMTRGLRSRKGGAPASTGNDWDKVVLVPAPAGSDCRARLSAHPRTRDALAEDRYESIAWRLRLRSRSKYGRLGTPARFRTQEERKYNCASRKC